MKVDDIRNVISNYERLSIREAKELYRKINETTNSEEKSSLREKLIFSTLYNVFEYVDNYKEVIEKASSYTVDEVLSIMMEAWIRIVASDEIEKYTSYKRILDLSFAAAQKELCNVEEIQGNMGKYFLISKSTGFLAAKIPKSVQVYMNIKEQNKDVPYDNCREYASYCDEGDDLFSISEDIATYHSVLDKMWEKEKFDKTDDLIFERKKYEDISYLLFERGAKERIKETDMVEEIEPSILEKAADEQFVEIFKRFMDKKPKEVKEIFYCLYGLNDGIPKTKKEVAKLYGCSSPKIAKIENRVLYSAGLNSEIREYGKNDDRINNEYVDYLIRKNVRKHY